MSEIFEAHESNVRSYCRSFPAVFHRAAGSYLFATDGGPYLDLLAGAGSLNYGHNNPKLVEPVIDYMRRDGPICSLDLHTEAKAAFIESFQRLILQPRGLSYKLQFPGPTGTNAVEAALKLARKVTGRRNVVAFSNAYHGASLGALALTTNPAKREAAGVQLGSVTFLPYDGCLGPAIDAFDVAERMLSGEGSGVDRPAAIVLEVVQGEGGLRCATSGWIRRVADLAKSVGALLIVDDIQAGCGRTGTFFSFETFGLQPDIVLLSKSLSGIGTPLSVVLLRPELDVWAPGEHNGTFRGNNLGFVAATAALRNFWSDDGFASTVRSRSEWLDAALTRLHHEFPATVRGCRGRGMMRGLEFAPPALARSASALLYREGVIAETCGFRDQVLKLMPPLTITEGELGVALAKTRKVIREIDAGC